MQAAIQNIGYAYLIFGTEYFYHSTIIITGYYFKHVCVFYISLCITRRQRLKTKVQISLLKDSGSGMPKHLTDAIQVQLFHAAAQ